MRGITELSISLIAATAAARPLQKRALQWSECSDIEVNSTLPYDCGTLAVPLDYTDESVGDLELSLLRVPAATQPSQGSVLFNFGGPGAEARNTLASLGPALQAATGGIYDLLAFDPRGTANTILFNCSSSALDLYRLARSVTVGNASDAARGQHWAFAHEWSETCRVNDGDIGQFLGTAFVARDLMSVVDALDEDGMLRFWGLSYGATLGQTVAAMFPDRMDKLVIDAVQNVQEYYNALGTVQQWSDSDKVFSGIWSSCIEAGPELCPLAASYDDAATLENDVFDLVEEIRTAPRVIGSNQSWVLDYPNLRAFYASTLYSTAQWPSTANITNKLLKGENDDELLAMAAGRFPLTREGELGQATASASLFGIQCSDRVAKTDNLDDLLPVLQDQIRTSRVMGDINEFSNMACSLWKLPAKEIYSGPWENITTNNPILFVGNTFDGHTPLVSAHNASAIFTDSVVLQVDGYGHGSTSLVSECATATLADYFVNGTMPEAGKICPIDVLPYHPIA